MNRRPLQRVRPKMSTGNYTTYSIRQPLTTHFRRATCAEVDCWAWKNGWRIRIEGTSPQDLHAARTSGRKYREVRVSATESYLVYDAGQPCFASHRTSLERPALFIAGRGDWRSFAPRKARVFTSDDWVDSFSTHLAAINNKLQQG